MVLKTRWKRIFHPILARAAEEVNVSEKQIDSPSGMGGVFVIYCGNEIGPDMRHAVQHLPAHDRSHRWQRLCQGDGFDCVFRAPKKDQKLNG